jgi:uridine kinase
MRNILINHYKKYPAAEIQDMVKLIYQNEFACRHIITDEAHNLKRLGEEYALLKKHQLLSDPDNDLLFEYIGNGLSRLHLRFLPLDSVNLKTINRFVIVTASVCNGSVKSFEEKLKLLYQCCEEQELAFAPGKLQAFIKAYRKKGFPPISHSKAYRDAYFPSYRIVSAYFGEFFELFCRIDQLMNNRDSKDVIIVAIDGNCGAGKSRLAWLLGKVYDCNIFHMDDFFLRPSQRTRKRLYETGGNVDYERFLEEVIKGIHSGEKFQYRAYNCETNTFDEPVTVLPSRLNIIEGSYSMHPKLINNYDLKIFLQISEQEQINRISNRNGSKMLKKFINEWIPKENKYFEKMKIKEQSDLIFINPFSEG